MYGEGELAPTLVTPMDTTHGKVGAPELALSEAIAFKPLPHARVASLSARQLIMC